MNQKWKLINNNYRYDITSSSEKHTEFSKLSLWDLAMITYDWKILQNNLVILVIF